MTDKRITVAVDWLQGSFESGMLGAVGDDFIDLDLLKTEMGILLGWPLRDMDIKPANGFYDVVLSSGDGVQLSINKPKHPQRSMVVLQGAFWDNNPQAGKVLHGLSQIGFKATRIDIAVDVVGYGWAVGNIRSDYEEVVRQSGRKQSFIDGAGRGDTYYIGSRTSQRMLRIYDKGMESGNNPVGGWLRFEGEFKGDLAIVMAQAARDNVAQTGSPVVAMLGGTGSMYERVLSDKLERGIVKLRTPRKPSKREKWLYGSVIAAIVKYQIEDGADAGDFLGFAAEQVRRKQEIEDIKRSGQLRLFE